ncbi:hypothetical protein MTR67_052972 [Solanum verrucosum]|uniref:Uncharacterized protein n=1 Tax=Solanum verrucosum TaxID=315347 RepID=A0AAF0V762_SOLVR|nr:hypothetical protein MTR67_052972 [Solanum verrucosum]
MERLAAKEVVVRKGKDDEFSTKTELLFIEYLKISKVCKVSGNGNNGYEVTEGADRHIINLREKKCTWRTWDDWEKKRQPRRGLIDEGEASEEDINCTAPQPTQESQSEYVVSSSYLSVVVDDDEDSKLRPRTISEEVFLTRLRKRQNPQEPIESRVIGFRCDKYGVSEPTNLLIAPTDLTWNGNDAITTNQLQKLRPRRG